MVDDLRMSVECALYDGAPIFAGIRPRLIASGTCLAPWSIADIMDACGYPRWARESWADVNLPSDTWLAAVRLPWVGCRLTAATATHAKFLVWRYYGRDGVLVKAHPRAVTRGLDPCLEYQYLPPTRGAV